MAACVRFRVAIASLCLLAIAVRLTACGGSGSTDTSSTAAANRPAPPASDFPKAAGKTLGEVLNSAAGPTKLVVSPGLSGLLQG